MVFFFFACLWAYAFTCVGPGEYTCMEARVHPWMSPPYFETVSLWILGHSAIQLGWLASELQGYSCVCLPSAGVPGVLCGCSGWNLGPTLWNCVATYPHCFIGHLEGISPECLTCSWWGHFPWPDILHTCTSDTVRIREILQKSQGSIHGYSLHIHGGHRRTLSALSLTILFPWDRVSVNLKLSRSPACPSDPLVFNFYSR